jgi:hypothetical protein
MKRLALALVSIALLCWTLVLNTYHLGVYRHPAVDPAEAAEGEWLDRRENGIHQLILRGPAFARGRRAGELTAGLLRRQEQDLVTQLSRFLPSPLLVQSAILGAIVWFQGVQEYIAPDDAREMYGTSYAAPHEFDYLADGFTRQVAYHGLHEVGQMMVDQGVETMGCTVVVVPAGRSIVIGRNFDFEAGRIFDTEKIMKWVFPEEGQPFVSVIWAGMVGAVTGVNASGVYVSINAAGTADRRRLGTPSTLVALKVLREARDATEAVRILTEARMFITDLFVVADAKGEAYRVEKTPERTAAIKLAAPAAVTNHLIAAEFTGDPVNRARREDMTSLTRERRALELLDQAPKSGSARDAVPFVLKVLRDKGVDGEGHPLPLGHRSAIDALIATHSVIYAPGEGTLYVSQGPALTGPFLGYDLKKSFASKRPVRAGELPADPVLSEQKFYALKEAQKEIGAAHALVPRGECDQAKRRLEVLAGEWHDQPSYPIALGDALACLHRDEEAKHLWRAALALHPPYARTRLELERKLSQ